MGKIGVAVVGFGNVGKFAVKAVESTGDMQLQGVVVTAPELASCRELRPDLLFTDDICSIEQVEVAVLAVPSMTVPEIAPHYLSLRINTVDAFDVHGEMLHKLKSDLHKVCLETNTASIIAAGWDPGTDSLIRAIFNIMAPAGITYVNFGPGMSMGHTVEVKKIPGVKDALSLTIPKGHGFHQRVVYVELEKEADADEVIQKIKSNLYFKNDETDVQIVAGIDTLLDYGHGVLMERKGVSSQTHNQKFVYGASLTNPAVTAQVLVGAARACTRQKPGCYIMLEVPLIDFFPENEKVRLIKELV